MRFVVTIGLLFGVIFLCPAMAFDVGDFDDALPGLTEEAALDYLRKTESLKGVSGFVSYLATGRLQSDDIRKRLEMRGILMGFRAQMIRGLLKSASQTKETYDFAESKTIAIELLSDFGATQAIPLLIREIEYNPPTVVDEASFLIGYPCAFELRNFGQKSAYEILSYLRTTAPERVSDKAIELYAEVFLEVYHQNAGGYQEAVAVAERAVERERHPNYLRLLDKLTEIARRERSID